MDAPRPLHQARSGTALDQMRTTAGLAYSAAHANEHFSAVRVHNSDQPVQFTIDGMSAHRISMKAAGLHMFDVTTLGKSLPDARIAPGLTAICSAHVDSQFSIAPHGGANFYFFIDPAYFEKVFEDDDPAGRTLELCNIPATTDPFFRRMLSSYLAEFESAQDFSGIALQSIALQISLHLARNYSTLVARAQETKRAVYEHTRIKRAKSYIHDNLERPIGLGDIAGAACLSQYHFVRIFKNAEGITPYQYVIRQRLSRANIMLLETNVSLAEIAVACGFSSQQHLTDAFRKAFATTPGAVRVSSQR